MLGGGVKSPMFDSWKANFVVWKRSHLLFPCESKGSSHCQFSNAAGPWRNQMKRLHPSPPASQRKYGPLRSMNAPGFVPYSEYLEVEQLPPSLLTPSHRRRSTQIGSALPRTYGLAAMRAVTISNNLSTRRESTRAIAGAPQDRVSHAVNIKWVNSLNNFRSWIII